MNPTDPITPVRALIEAAGKATPGPWELEPQDQDEDGYTAISASGHHGLAKVVTALDDGLNYYETWEQGVATANFIKEARNATASISQLLSEHDKVVEYIKELRADRGATEGYDECADRLQSIQEGK